MSTRATIKFANQKQHVLTSKKRDGFPTIVIPMLLRYLRNFEEAVPKAMAKNFTRWGNQQTDEGFFAGDCAMVDYKYLVDMTHRVIFVEDSVFEFDRTYRQSTLEKV